MRTLLLLGLVLGFLAMSTGSRPITQAAGQNWIASPGSGTFSVGGTIKGQVWPHESTDLLEERVFSSLYVRIKDKDLGGTDEEYPGSPFTSQSDGTYRTPNLNNANMDPLPHPEGEPYVFSRLEGPWAKVLDEGFLGLGLEPEHRFEVTNPEGDISHNWTWVAEVFSYTTTYCSELDFTYVIW